MAIGTRVFPTSLTAASTWNPGLLYDMGSVIGLEAAAQGSNIGYGPVLDVAREPRWSRMEETFGEDPWLTSVLGTAVVRGMLGDDTADKQHVICTLKHLAAYGVPEGGHNGGQPSLVGTINRILIITTYFYEKYKNSSNIFAWSIFRLKPACTG